MKKTGINRKEFTAIKEKMLSLIKFLPLQEYQKELNKAANIPDKNDIDFVALAIKMNCAIWSNDKELKNQDLVKIFSTKELLKELF